MSSHSTRLAAYFDADLYEHVPAKAVDFLADGREHEGSPPKGDEAGVQVSYRVLSGCERVGPHVVFHLRLERTYTRQVRDGLLEMMPEVVEETLSGTLDEDEQRIAGTSVHIRQVPGINFDPAELRRSFVMERVGPRAVEELAPP